MIVALLALAFSTSSAPPVVVPARPPADEMAVAGPTGTLKGTFAGPLHGAPVAIIIPGSGPTDRDGNNRLGITARPYRLLAEALATRGVSTVRIDKHGMFGSKGAGDANAVTMEVYAADMAAWTRAVRARTGAACVWLIGHSEGAMTALVTAQTDRDVCGLVLIAGTGRPLSTVLREQLRANPGLQARPELMAVVMKDLDIIQSGGSVDGSALPGNLGQLFSPKVQPFLRDMFRRDPPALVRAYRGPVLVVQGTTDLQVAMADAELLAGARPSVKLVRIAGMNHVLKSAPAARPANVATYVDPDLPLAPGLVDSVAGFIRATPIGSPR